MYKPGFYLLGASGLCGDAYYSDDQNKVSELLFGWFKNNVYVAMIKQSLL